MEIPVPVPGTVVDSVSFILQNTGTGNDVKTSGERKIFLTGSFQGSNGRAR